ncbi:hypothetical protein [Archangium primigenium]|uniref:SitA5 family polymorphic toxin n=1 Tax=[Archangium] primigenium TaxID=2792470 RepID=UPI00195A4A9F|nr:hypothetical protein [Archangium primigenium]MBM7112183.1 hypothetical protein [Archangium primigenium]
MSTRIAGPRMLGVPLRLLLRVWFLIVLTLHAACATGVPRSCLLVGSSYQPPTPRFHEDARPPTAEAEARGAEEGEVADGLVRLSLPTRFGAVQVRDFELNEALATLVLNMPLRVADSRFPLYLHRKLALASFPLTGEEWRTPLARSYGSFCEQQGTPGDCLELFKDGPGLGGEDKRDLALALSVNAALEARDAELRGMFSRTQLWTTLSITLMGYMALVVAPEPVSKGVAAALALLMWGYLGWELFDLVRAWFKLWEEAAEASTFAELREAGDRFGKVIGPNSVRILLLLGTAAVGETAALVSKTPKLPGFAKAAGAIESHAGIRDVLTAVREADKVKVVVAEGTIRVVLPANVLAMTVDGPSKSEHARQRQIEGRPVGTALNDARNARPADVFIQSENDRFVIRGPNGREHIFEQNGTHVTTVAVRSAAAHRSRVQSGVLRLATEHEFNAFKSLFER